MRSKILAVGLALTALIAFRGFAHAASVRASGSGLEHQMLGLINQDRASSGLAPVHMGGALTRVALGHSLDMAQNHYFSHFTPSGISPYGRLAHANIHYNVAGENLGWESGAGSSAMLSMINQSMLNSPEHRANLLRRSFTKVGIGIAFSGGRMVVTEDFKG